jgi:glycosyltransferase involved in cell wall biosynthesis
MAKKICRRVKEIHPDLVLLVGAENAYYSSAVLTIKGYPIYVLCQNIINNPEYVTAGTQDKINASTELEIIRQSRYMGVYSKKHYDLLRDAGYDKFVFDFNWPTLKQQQYKPVPSDKKDYDFVNFALHMSEEKGYHDSIKALSIVKQHHPNVKLCLVDGGPDTVRNELKQLIAKLDLDDNVSFIPFFAERKDLFQFLQTVRFAILPCKIDHISGTQLQSMIFGLPVVCYKTTGTPLLNKEKECVLIAEKDNISELAEKMLVLMNDEEKANSLRNNSLEYMKERRLRSLGNMQRLVDNFNAILANYRQGTPIPEEQLFENSSQE